MNENKNETWQDVWTRKAKQHRSNDYSLSELMKLDGYDISCSSVNEQQFLRFTEKLVERIGLADGASILEIGCGAGALCKALADMGYKVTGLDYTAELVDVCRNAIPDGTFKVGEAANFDFTHKDFDAVISHSVFHYFPSQQYAVNVFHKMVEHCKTGGIVALTDMHDKRLQKEHDDTRRAMIGEEEYNRLYANLSHTFYFSETFTQAASLDCSSSWLEPQFLTSESGRFKFNFFARK